MNTVLEYLAAPSAGSEFALLVIKSSLIALLGLALCRLLRRASASTRHIALGATLVAILLLPAAGRLAPPLSLPVIDPAIEHTTPPVIEFDATTFAPRPVMSPVERSTAVKRSMSTGQIAIAVYLLGALGVLLYLSLGLVRIVLISRRSTDAGDDPLWTATRQEVDLGKRRVRLRKTAEAPAPLTWGVHVPTVLLPVAADGWSREDRRNAMLHELAHVRRRDWLTHVLARVVCAVYWFNPLVWASAWRLDLEAEHAADDDVLRSGSCPAVYAEQLLALTRTAQQGYSLPVAAAPMARRKKLGRRVASILNSGENRMPVNRIASLAIVGCFAATTLLIGAAELVVAQDAGGGAGSETVTTQQALPLHTASAAGNYGEVARLIEEGVDVNREMRRSFGPYQRTALGTAARAGHADIAELLIRSGADINPTVRGDATPLMEALRFNHTETVDMLLANGADVNRVARGDGSPLIAAARAGNSDGVRLLLDNGADPDRWVPGDENPLFHAVKRGHTDIVQMLIDAGADVNREMPGDGNPLIVAISNGQQEVADLLISAGARGDDGVQGDGNALIVAAENGDLDLLRKMIATGADVNASIERDGSPLIAASRNGHLDAAMLLVNNGADVNGYVYGDETPLIGAAWKGDVDMVNYLLSVGADPTFQAKTYGGRTRSALKQASSEGHQDVVAILKAAGATR